MKRPSFQFYPGDWLEDVGLRASCLAARGLWADMLCFMHQGEPYGHLRKNGRDITLVQLARMVGEGARRVEALLAELEANHVLSRNEDGTIFSRRQVRDESLRDVRARGGSEAPKNPRASRPGEARDGGRPTDKEGGGEGGMEGGAQGGGDGNPPSSPSPSPASTPPPRTATAGSAHAPGSALGRGLDALLPDGAPIPKPRQRKAPKPGDDTAAARQGCDDLAEILEKPADYSRAKLALFARLEREGRTREEWRQVLTAYRDGATSSAAFARHGNGSRPGGPGLGWALRPGDKGGFDRILLDLDGGQETGISTVRTIPALSPRAQEREAAARAMVSGGLKGDGTAGGAA